MSDGTALGAGGRRSMSAPTASAFICRTCKLLTITTPECGCQHPNLIEIELLPQAEKP